MSTITKERVAGIASGEKCYTHDDVVELARIALASREAVPVAVRARWKDEGSGHGNWKYYDIAHRDALMADETRECELIYTAPPAPVSVPDAIHSQGEKSASDDYYALGWNACRAAMLQGAELVKAANKLPDDFDFDRFNDVVWLEAVASNPHMHSPTTSTIAMVALELNRKLADGKSPVIPDGWVLVPVEPTEKMIIEGFESEPDEFFSDEKEWEAYDAMSGCQQAAHRAKLCWAAMIAASPKPEVK